ncbi:DUF1707 SHOCT-like domain-containing protein [Streptomyces termitum]
MGERAMEHLPDQPAGPDRGTPADRPADLGKRPERKAEEAKPALRVSDRERDVALGVLAAALAEGRLDPQEHAERTEAALRARTAADLAVLTADLPAPRPGREELARGRRASRLAEWRRWASVAVILTAIWGVNGIRDGELHFYWPVTVLGIWGAVLVARSIRRGEDEE